MQRILVIGGTGTVGREVLAQLSVEDPRVRALVRNPDTAALPPHVEVVSGDLTRPETLTRALDDIDAVFLVWCAPAPAIAAALERLLKHTRKIVFLSSPHKTAHPFFQRPQPNPVAAIHAEIDSMIESSGREWTLLRPGMFAANALSWWAPRIRAGENVVRWPFAAAPTAPIHEHDIAAVAVRALCDDGHSAAEYLITGPQSLSQAEQLAIIGDVIGRPVRLQEISPDEARQDLLSVLPPPAVKMLMKAWEGAIGQPALVTSTVAKVTGAPARTFRDWAIDHAAAFTG